MKILAVCAGNAERLPGKTYKTGINKVAIGGPVMIDAHGVVGDAVCNPKHHGGPDQAVYVEGARTLEWFARALGRTLPPGTFGENLVIDDLDNRDVAVGDRFIAGDLVLEVTSARTPCATFAAKMGDPTLIKRYYTVGRPGIYCRVLSAAVVQAGMEVSCRRFDGERVTMPQLLESATRRLSAKEAQRYLAAPIGIRLRQKIEKQLRPA